MNFSLVFKNNLRLGSRFVIFYIIFSLLLIIGILAVVVSANDYFYLKANGQKLKIIFEKKQKQAAQLPYYQQQFSLLREQFQHFCNSSLNNITNYISLLTTTANNYQLQVIAALPLATLTQNIYTILPIQLKLVGSYQQIFNFISAIYTVQPNITWHDFKLQKTNENNEALEFVVMIKIYQLSKDKILTVN